MSDTPSNSEQKTIPPVTVDIEFWGVKEDSYEIRLFHLDDHSVTPSDPDLSELKLALKLDDTKVDCRLDNNKLICTASPMEKRFETDKDGNITFQCQGISLRDIERMNRQNPMQEHRFTVTLSEVPQPKLLNHLKPYLQTEVPSAILELPSIRVRLTYETRSDWPYSRPWIRCEQISQDTRYQDVHDQSYQQRLEDLLTCFSNKDMRFVPDPNNAQEFFVSCFDYDGFLNKEADNNSQWYKMSRDSVDNFNLRATGKITRSVEFGVLTKDEDNNGT